MTFWKSGYWRTLKRLLLVFWGVWLTLVVVSNAAEALKALGVLPESFAFASGNYQTILDVLAPFGLPDALGALLFAGAILWEAVAAALFWWAGLTFHGYQNSKRRGLLVLTFAVSLGLWGAFQIACEALPSPLAYQLAGTHRLLFTETLATLLVVVLLPDD
jgi:hypothetical protein